MVAPPVVVLFGVAWALAVLTYVSGTAEALHHHDVAHGGLWAGLALFLVAWPVHVAAMMLPSSLPMVANFDRVAAGQPRYALIRGAFLSGYLAVWTLFGVVALAADLALHRLVERSPWLAGRPGVITGAVLAGAGLFQFSALKDRCLRECRHPGAFIVRHYRRGAGGATSLGLRHGLFCLGCCWALMLVMFAVGIANLPVMAILALVMIYEKTGRWGHAAGRWIGSALVLLGIVMLARPSAVPTFLIGGWPVTSSLFSLEGRVALVTGGNGGLGRDIALGLQGAGATVAIIGRDDEKNRAVSEELRTAGAVIHADVRDEDAVAAAVADVVERFGHLDVLVNNAGNFSGGSLLEMSRASWDSVVETHLTGSFLCAKHAARHMVERGEGGKIINIGSMYSMFGPPAYANYAAAKTGVLGLTRALAVELGAHGIQANAILPGWFETALTRGAPATEWGERIRRKTPAARWGTGEDLVGTAVFLASHASDFVTGVALPVDGGYAVADRLLPE